MNRFVDILNRIRERATAEWFTPSQRAVYDLLIERLGFLDEVNLWGRHGVGKTFIGWILYKTGQASYFPLPKRVQNSVRRTVVVDNTGWQRLEVLDVLHCCRSKGYDKIVFITDEPVAYQIATIELTLTKEDIEKVSVNLRSVGLLPYTETPRHLWDMVSPIELFK